MPKLDPVGFIDHPEDVDLEPITLPICGIRVTGAKRESVCEEFMFPPIVPFTNTIALNDAVETGASRAIVENTVKWLTNWLTDDEERERFKAFLTAPDILIERQTIEDAWKALGEYYAARPTGPPSSSNGTGGSTKRTSRAGSRAAASRSRQSRSA